MYRIVPGRVFIAAAVSISVGLYSYYRKRERLSRWVRVTAVVDNVRRDREGNTTATFKYSDKNGERRMCLLPIADAQSLGLGSEMALAYNPDVPDQAFVCDTKDMNITLIVSLLLGVGFIIAGILALRSGATLYRL